MHQINLKNDYIQTKYKIINEGLADQIQLHIKADYSTIPFSPSYYIECCANNMCI